MTDLALARRTVTSAFGLDGRFERMATGLDTTYRLTTPPDGARYAVRLGASIEVRRPAAMQVEAAWITALASSPSNELVVPEVMRTHDGDEVATLTDDLGRERAVLVLTWLRGRKMRWRFTPNHAYRLGAATAALHRHADSFELPAGGWAKSWTVKRISAIDRVEEVVAIAGDDARAAHTAVYGELVAAEAALLEQAEERPILINGDIGPHNVVWRSDDPRPGLFDFNDLGMGWAGWDLARSLGTLRWRPAGEALVIATLAGYQSVAPLPRSFTAHGRLFERASRLLLAAYLAPKVAERGPDTAATVRRLVADAISRRGDP